MIPLLFLATGCSQPDERLHEMAQQSLQQQAQQNETIAQQTTQLTAVSDKFIAAEGQARQELLDLQQRLVEAEAQARQQLLQTQADVVRRDAEGRSELNEQQTRVQAAMATLEQERRQIAAERHRAPIVAAAITQVGFVLACLTPLAFGAYLLFVLQRTGDCDNAMVEMLVQELTSEQPRLLPRPAMTPALTDASAPGPEDASTEPRPDSS